MSKSSQTAVSEFMQEETAVSSLYPGMQVLTVPGLVGVALVPEPDEGYLSALQIARFLKRQAPPELEAAGAIYVECYARAPLVDWRFENLPMTDERLISLDYPYEMAKWVYEATQPHLVRIFDKKK
jgi:hypothetical protein